MIFKRRNKFKRYKNDFFSFEYSSYMTSESREEDMISFFKKKDPTEFNFAEFIGVKWTNKKTPKRHNLTSKT